MTTTATPTTPTKAGAGTERARRQLQELDALLQQMLALPIGNPAEASPSEATAKTEETIAPAAIATLASPAPSEPPNVRVDSFTEKLDRLTSNAAARPLSSISDKTTTAAPAMPKKLESIGQLSSLRRSPLAPCREDIKAPLPLLPAILRQPPPAATTVGVPSKSTPSVSTRVEPTAVRTHAPLTQQPKIVPALMATPVSPAPSRHEPQKETPSPFDLAGPESYDVSPSNEGSHIDGDFLDAVTGPSNAAQTPMAARYRWLVGVNAVYDGIFGRLGPLGDFLTSPFVKNLLGIVGLGMLAWAIWLSGWLR